MSIQNEEVENLVHQKVHLEILRKTLQWDRYHLQRTKMRRIYMQLIDHLMEKISEELRKVKEKLNVYEARIIQEEQREKDRFVIYRHQGYLFEKQYFNPIIKMECEKLLKRFLKI